MTREMVELDLDLLNSLLLNAAQIVEELERLDALPVDHDGAQRRSNQARADVNHALLHLQTILQTAAGEAGMQYWRMRGRPDARFEDVA